MIKYSNTSIDHNGEILTVPYPVLEAFEYQDKIIVLYDPDAMPSTAGQFPNLVCINSDGQTIWSAELPTTKSTDVYYKITSKKPLVAYSFCSFKCEIDASSGKIVKKEFFK